MNRKTTLRKTWMIGMSALIGLAALSCVGQENLQAKLVGALDRTPAPKVKLSAALIGDNDSGQSPHLRPHRGQILLARDGLQLVVPTLSLLTDSPSHYSLLSQIYRLHAKNWQSQSWLPLPEIVLRSESGDDLQLVGRDIENTADAARVTSVFRSRKAPFVAARLVMSLLASSSALEVEIQSSDDTPLVWAVQLGRGVGEEFAIPFVQNYLAGMSIALLPDVISLVSSTPLVQKVDDGYVRLANAKASSRSGFYLFFDKAGMQQQAAVVAQALSCYRDKEANGSLGCLRAAWSTPQSWSINQPVPALSQKNERRLMRPIYIHSREGAFRSVLPIYEGEQLKVALSPLEPFELLFPDVEGVLAHKRPDDPPTALELPEILRGSLTVQLDPPSAAFLEIRDAIHGDGLAIQAFLSVKGSPAISPHSLLQKSWPLSVQLPAGDYRIQVFGGDRIYCQQRITVLPDKRQQLPCSFEGARTALAFSPRASLSLDANRNSKEMLQAASMQIYGRDARLPPGGPHEVPLIEVSDPNLGLSLKAFPADEALRTAWQLARTRGEASTLQEFAAFARSQKPPLQLVLECPAPGFQLEEYSWLALSLEPDFLEIFGCQQPERAEELMGVAHRLQQKVNKAIKFTVASPLRSLYQLSTYLPALYIPPPPGKSSIAREDIIESLRSGAFSVGLRSEILLAGGERGAKGQIKELTLRLRSHDLKSRSGLLRIHDQNGPLSEQPIAQSAAVEEDLKIPLTLKPSSRWLRIELLLAPEKDGSHSNTKHGDGFLLATSNFLSLDGAP